MKDKNQTLTTLGDKFSGRIHEAFRCSSINKLHSNIEIERLITYNEVLGDFITLGYCNLYNEFEERVCLGECPNTIIVSLINRDSEYISTMGYLLEQINYFIDKDIMKYFN